MRISPLDRKLLRDIMRMPGQIMAIVLVMASGVAAFVMLIGVMESLDATRERFYRDYRFADAFAQAKRAPERVADELRAIPGVRAVETRVVAEVSLEVDGYAEPVTGRLVSMPDEGSSNLNRLHLQRGRMIAPYSTDEAILSDAFSAAHNLGPGDMLHAIVNGRKKALRVVGIGLSPEYVLQVRPGAISPDYKRYAIIWMNRSSLSAAYDMEGAFNDVAMSLYDKAVLKEVLFRVDSALAPYGGLFSYTREDQISHRYLTEEFKQLRRSAGIFPIIFIVVAAFLLNVVMSRTVATQRDQIAALKAFGYRDVAIGAHYLKFVSIIVALGVLAGLVLGFWLGQKLGNVYMAFYRFPFLDYGISASTALVAGGITFLASFGGTLFSVRRSVRLPPAEALRPEPPALFRRGAFTEKYVAKRLSQTTLMIVRNIGRRPVKSTLTVIGIAMSCAIMLAGTFSMDSIDYMIDVQFRVSQKEDMSVTFIDDLPEKAAFELSAIEGVHYVEPTRSVPVRFVNGNRSYRTVIRGVGPNDVLQRLVDVDLNPIKVPPAGLLLTDYLGETLGVGPGDTLTVETLVGKRRVEEVVVAGLVKQYLGVMGYMHVDALRELMREGPSISGANLSVEPGLRRDIYSKLAKLPRVVGTTVREDEITNFYATQAEALLFFTFISSILGATIAFGVIYNSARIALSERSRELASLRVLGYKNMEVSYIFLGEFALLTLVSIPIGFVIGLGLCEYIARSLSTDLFRVPVVVGGATLALAATVVLVSAVLSGAVVQSRLLRLDLVEVLKARE